MERQAEGFAKIVAAAGVDVDKAVQLMLVDKLEELMKIQVKAVKNLQIDKVTVWDSMNGKNGSPLTAGFLSGMLKSIPPLQDTFAMAGVKLPGFLEGKPEAAPSEAPQQEQAEPH